VTGGRNLGDAYFLRNKEANFVDLDLLAAGPVVHSMSRLFDAFWNSELAYPVHAVVDDAPARPASAALDTPARLPEPPAARVEARARALRAGSVALHWMPARLIGDQPSKSLKQGEPNAAETMFDDLRALLRSARSDVLIVSPYFIPGRDGMALIGELRRRGVRVRVLTASLEATDVPLVHLGYSRYREPLLALGVELHELRPEFDAARQRGGVHSRTNLHSKAIVVDSRTVLVGSMNLDPRSDKHNTEMGLLAHGTALAEELQRLLEPALRHGAYRVVLAEDGRLRWIAVQPDGRAVELKREPNVGWGKLIGLRLLAPLAPEEML
jgi:phosphatidylserine/phosphatidylglycerophosphate/cardiolipin synthase-like enzyme